MPSLTHAQVITALAASYPNFKLTPDTIRAYSGMLADIPPDELQAGIVKVVATSKFFPSIAEIRGAVAELRMVAANIPTAAEAWQDICRAWDGERRRLTGEADADGNWLMTVEYYAWRHPLVEQVARQLGWPRDFPSNENLMADRAHFFKAWEGALRQAVSSEMELPQIRDYLEARKAGAMTAGDIAKRMLGDGKR